MSMILDKSKKNEYPKIKQLGNLKKNIINTQEKTNLYVKSINTKSPLQKSFIINKKRNQKSNDINYSKNTGNDIDDMNFLLSGENDPFSRSVIYSNNKKLSTNLFPSLKNRKINDILDKRNPNSKILNNKYNNKRKIGANNHSVKNSNIKANRYGLNKKINISGDFSGISKFNEKFQLIEDKIIDKNYENDIDNDEIIIGTNKKNINNNVNNLLDNIQINNKYDNDDLYIFFKNNNNEDNDNEEEYLINNNYENNKNDFFIMYIDNYEKMINDDMLLLEIQLLYEKILDLQNAYHEEYKEIISRINKNKKFLSLIIYKYKEIHKKKFNILKIKENNNCKKELNTFLNIQKKENNSYITDINNKEINLWKNMLGNNFKRKNSISDNKKIIKDIFIKNVFDKYYYVKNDMNDIENKIVLNLMKKFNYKMLTDKNNKKRNYINGNYTGSNNNIKKDKIIKTKINNHKIINSNNIYDSRINNRKNFIRNNNYSNNYSSYNNYINASKRKGY